MLFSYLVSQLNSTDLTLSHLIQTLENTFQSLPSPRRVSLDLAFTHQFFVQAEVHCCKILFFPNGWEIRACKTVWLATSAVRDDSFQSNIFSIIGCSRVDGNQLTTGRGDGIHADFRASFPNAVHNMVELVIGDLANLDKVSTSVLSRGYKKAYLFGTFRVVVVKDLICTQRLDELKVPS